MNNLLCLLYSSTIFVLFCTVGLSFCSLYLLYHLYCTFRKVINRHVQQDKLTLPGHLISTKFFGCVLCNFLSVCLLVFLTMEFSVYFQVMTLNVPLVSYAPFLFIIVLKTNQDHYERTKLHQ